MTRSRKPVLRDNFARPGMNPRARATAFLAAGTALGMLLLAFAAEPIYSTFCKVTGFGGTTRVAEKPSDRVLDRKVRIRFDANVDKGLGLTFFPEQEFVDARVGETVMRFYQVTNSGPHPVKAVAGYNVVPFKAGKYFNKVECFCFKEKLYQPGATERLPVVFFVSPDMADDRAADDIRTITLSYTYHFAGTPIPPPTARLEDASAGY